MNQSILSKLHFSAAALAMVCVAGPVSMADAHPGHGSPALENTPLHWLEPSHFGIAILGIAAGLLFAKLLKRRSLAPTKTR